MLIWQHERMMNAASLTYTIVEFLDWTQYKPGIGVHRASSRVVLWPALFRSSNVSHDSASNLNSILRVLELGILWMKRPDQLCIQVFNSDKMQRCSDIGKTIFAHWLDLRKRKRNKMRSMMTCRPGMGRPEGHNYSMFWHLKSILGFRSIEGD